MDFMRLLKSVEELLYELVTWILFYPLTLWRCLRHPVRMMNYASTELGDAEAEQYDDALSPPIFLLLTLFIAHLIELRFGVATKVVLPDVFADERNLLFFRAIAFSLFPLLLALQDVRRRGAKLTRRTLKPAFYSQCYAAAPFILSIDLAVIIAQHSNVAAVVASLAAFVAGLIWYVGAETAWLLLDGRLGRPRALLNASGAIALGFVAVLVVLVLTAWTIMAPA
ncbi:permease [Devosia neptuniae]|uniref:Permease n=1 Tax=Devosia neptuniae TaxID=191302 RepID=A0ABY6CC63_9HYPH|nr:permease [Devosia neptuniae]UXN69730.1 permease [Devosia neptuniae]